MNTTMTQDFFPPAQEMRLSRKRPSKRVAELIERHNARLQKLKSVQQIFNREQR